MTTEPQQKLNLNVLFTIAFKDVHSKGIILRAFEQFGLKSCINFIPRQNEDYFIHIQKLGG